MNDPLKTVIGPEQEPAPLDNSELPERIGRYRVERVLGHGGFGIVYLAHDDQLQRLVAIKVPLRSLMERPEDAEAYLSEARTVAILDHPNIVPVFDVGSTDDCPCFVVSKYIDGIDLAVRLTQSRLSIHESVELVATVAQALHHAHQQGLVHRDIKPGNLLLDKSGKPFVVDFGLALREQDVGKGPRFAGTPAYMSPEQARGEGHRVDSRSDIFSLGVVLYELLGGRPPFQAKSMAELIEQITTFEARPLRQMNEAVSRELERICLKALSKRIVERYTSAQDVADDLRHVLSEQSVNPLAGSASIGATFIAAPPLLAQTSTAIADGRFGDTSITTPTSGHEPSKIVPKGLRSFDAHDADFFLELLPGPRDRDGLPDSIRFWKTRIEETDADNTFSVGLIYGPSGCGKSSLVKAGLLPRLSKNVVVIYVEATAGETETRLLNGLRKWCSALPNDLSLKEMLAALRRGQGIPAGQKVVIILDQFEQWLHAKKEEQNTELVQALRQCDGGRVQCIVMVRDDFWLSVSRFLRELEIRLLEGHNSALTDLFDVDHARKVLSAFGRAFGKLPENLGGKSKEQKEFLTQAVSGLAQEGKVICVRLALFAEMMKGKTWTPATLKGVGGTEGVGVTFLEETFSAATSPPQHRYHQKAARGVLKALLPESGTDIKGHMRSHSELLQASGYTNRLRDFDDLIRMLDSEIRLITPTDPEGKEIEASSQSEIGEKYYQLSHDYLVSSLRVWLTFKQKETRRGRAELRLADRAFDWNARPENRRLPSLLQWLNMRLLTQKKNWTQPQTKMMRKARKYHAARGLMTAIALVVIGWGSYQVYGTQQAQALRERLLDANTNEVPTIIQDMAAYRPWLDPLLQKALTHAEASQDSRKQLHASLALLPVDRAQVEYLYGRLLDAEPQEVPVILSILAPYKDALKKKLWGVAESPDRGKESQRLRAAAALASYDRDSDKWAAVQDAVANGLVMVPAVHLAVWMESLRPVRAKLLNPLTTIFRDAGRRDAERSMATDILADYAADQRQVLANLLVDADDKQFAVIFPKFKEQGAPGQSLLTSVLEQALPPGASDDARETLAKRQANAAVALLKLNDPERVWPLLKQDPDPRVRSILIHSFGPLGADVGTLINRLDAEPDVTIRRALILSLGEFAKKDISAEERNAATTKLQSLYLTDPDPGLHAAAEWLLRTWDQESWLRQVNEEWASDPKRREKFIQQMSATENKKAAPQWYVNGQGQTMVVISAREPFLMGSPTTEAGRQDAEVQHLRRIGRTFAIAAKSVTVEQFRKFDAAYELPQKYTRVRDLPIVGASWHRAAAYCNWLSNSEGIPEDQWCYIIKGQGTELKSKYLSLQGYRLPTEAEMEFATRAGAVTSRYFGESDALLAKYAWCQKNSQERTWPVGSLKPNDFGLFDMQGNVFNWCQDSYQPYPAVTAGEVAEDHEDDLKVNDSVARVLRGGSLELQPSHLRSASRTFKAVPTNSYNGDGFRVARTLPSVAVAP